jgi:hypothetical protein
MQDTEHAHQVTVVNWFRKTYPNYLIYAVPNGELRAMSVAQRLKAEGVVSGIPDLEIIIDNGVTIRVEMKKEKGGVVSKEQKAIHAKMEELGHKVLICKGYKDAINQLSYIL